MTADQGRSGVVRAALGAAAAELADRDQARQPEQLALLEIPTRFSGEKAAKAQRTLTDHHRARGAGRPEGATNVSTRQLRELLLQRGVSPLESMMRWALHTPATLADELDCTKLEAFDRIRALWNDMAPYLHSRMAPVDDQGNAVMPIFNMIFGGGAAPGAVAGIAPWFADPEVRRQLELEAQTQPQQNQVVSASAAEVSHDGLSHNDASD